jgi:hypothetical protein
MRGCRGLSNSKPEVDGLDDLLMDREQAAFDLAFSREGRRDQQGYVTPAQARAFLKMSRQRRSTHDAVQPGHPLMLAYFRAIESTDAADVSSATNRLLPASDTPVAADDHRIRSPPLSKSFVTRVVAQPPRARSAPGTRV